MSSFKKSVTCINSHWIETSSNPGHAWSIPDCSSMPINKDQILGIDPKYGSINIIIDQFRSIKINFTLYLGQRLIPDQRHMYLIYSKIDLHWPELIDNDLYWSTLGSISKFWSLLIFIDQHWGLIQHVLIINVRCTKQTMVMMNLTEMKKKSQRNKTNCYTVSWWQGFA